MGSFNGTCAVSNLHVTAGKDVTVFLLLENKQKKDFCYGNALYDLCPIPFYGKYDDYGGVEDCTGFGLPIVMDALKTQLYAFGQGPNEYHDTEINRNNLDITKLFEADHEGRLGIQAFPSHDGDSYDRHQLEKMRDDNGLSDSQQFELDRLAAKIKQIDTFRRVTHVIIHGDVFKDILEKWYIKDYVGDGQGDAGWDNNYRYIYFKDLIGSIPVYVENQRKATEEAKSETNDNARAMKFFRRFHGSGDDAWNSENLATQWMSRFDSTGSSAGFGLVNVKETIHDLYIDNEDWDGLTAFVTEALTGAWINSFMGYVNKLWSKQVSAGQDTESLGFLILAKSVEDVLEAQRKQYDEDSED